MPTVDSNSITGAQSTPPSLSSAQIPCSAAIQTEDKTQASGDGEPILGCRPASELSLSNRAIALLQAIERLRLEPYDDQTGRAISQWVSGATIGYGHLITRLEWPRYQERISESEAERLFLSDARPFEQVVAQTIQARLRQHQFDALVIFAFNVGTPAFRSSLVARLINTPPAAAEDAQLEIAWKAWNRSQGQVNRGLNNRRAAEWRIYKSAVYARW